MKIQSNFTDFYDEQLKNYESNLRYKRLRGKFTRTQDLFVLKQLGIKTIEVGTIREMSSTTNKFVVYTNPYEHGYNGKEIYTYSEVGLQYNNYLLSPFLEEYEGKTIKYLQLGERRFRITQLNKDYKNVLSAGEVIDITELPKQFNGAIKLPIYSIDYIARDREMIAIDFNRVQKLDTIGIDKILSGMEVTKEIEKALIRLIKENGEEQVEENEEAENSRKMEDMV